MKKEIDMGLILRIGALILVFVVVIIGLITTINEDEKAYNGGECRKCGGYLEETKHFIDCGSSYTTYHCTSCSYQCVVKDSKIER